MWTSLLLAILWGLAEGVGLSGSGHAVGTRVVAAAPDVSPFIASLCSLGAAVGLFVSIGRTWVDLLGAGLKAATRPALFQEDPHARLALLAAIAGATASLVALGLDPFVAGWRLAPLSAGAGLVVSAIALASTAAAPFGELERPTLAGAALAGAALGFAVLPGASWVGLSLVSLFWLRVERQHLAPMALVCATPAMAIHAIKGLATHPTPGASTWELLVWATAAAVCAAVGFRLLDPLIRRQSIPWLGAWTITLAVALLGFAYATARSGF